MHNVDLNLLSSLDMLLTERSVTHAARRLGLSPSAMSRTLARLRVATGDQLLVQAGRTLVPTPYAEQLAEQVHELARHARAVLQPMGNALNIATLDRTFTIRANDGFVDLVGPALIATIAQTAPLVRLCFVPKPDKDAQPLREGMLDLEVGVIGSNAPELKTRLLFQDRFVGICRTGHPLLNKPGVTAERYASYPHVVVSRKRRFFGPVDDALAQQGLRRTVVMVVPGCANALQIVRHSDLIGLVPLSSLGNGAASAGLQHFELPVPTPPIKVSAIWHPRLHADPAHRWLRETLLAVCNRAQPTATI
ncbi:LysR family transcriptional regulator [Paludibacterium purpuratum]|uniref:LysR family transcriptional regulator n=1 Tax=Paludibacterium purpuratum TaxID=1144873 RepID=A0A4R7BCM2_9NEIS|nr:LysR family transcriptional regulator [Paludibacterium purpuratum]TDR81902.1 LysR family transcriptional regulator [Paludibacterium purpuratum]